MYANYELLYECMDLTYLLILINAVCQSCSHFGVQECIMTSDCIYANDEEKCITVLLCAVK